VYIDFVPFSFFNEILLIKKKSENGRVDWHVTFVRNFNDWELDSVAFFLGSTSIPSSFTGGG
jgi:hypothetical protein